MNAAKILLKLTKEIPAALTDCQNISSDVQEIEAWASQFSSPITDAKIIATNALKNYKDIMSAGADISTQVKAGEWFKAGSDAAEVLTDTLGPVTTTSISAHPKVAGIGKFVEGFVGELLQIEDFQNLENCIADSESLYAEVMLAVSDFKEKDIADILKGITIIGNMASELPKELADCKAVEAGLPELKKWAQMFKNPMALAKTLAMGVVAHYPEIYADIQDLEGHMSEKDYTIVGKDVADILVLSLGEVSEMEVSELEFDLENSKKSKKIVEGILFELTGDKNVFSIDDCIVDSDKLLTYVNLALEDFEKHSIFGTIKGLTELGLIVKKLPADLAECKAVSGDIQIIKSWVQKFSHPVSDAAKILENVTLNFDEIEKNVKKVESNLFWGANEKAGMRIGDIIKLALGDL